MYCVKVRLMVTDGEILQITVYMKYIYNKKMGRFIRRAYFRPTFMRKEYENKNKKNMN